MEITTTPRIGSQSEIVQQQLVGAVQQAMLAATHINNQDLERAFGQSSSLSDAIYLLQLRDGQVGMPANAAAIRDAMENNIPLGALFSGDPGSLGGSLAEADVLAQALARAGVDAGAAIAYPVVVSTTSKAGTVERLVWMSATERAALNVYPNSSHQAAEGMTRVDAAEHGVTVYWCLDAYASRRLSGQSLETLLAQLNSLDTQLSAHVHKAIAAALASGRDFQAVLQILVGILNSSLENKMRDLEKMMEMNLEDQEKKRVLELQHEALQKRIRREWQIEAKQKASTEV